MSGRYLAFEGIEGTGKTTVAMRIAELLEQRGHDVLIVREPGGTETGEQIRQILLHGGDLDPRSEAMLFAAQRAQLVAEVVRPALEAGIWVISDRTAYSSLAYQGEGRGLGIDRVREINDVAIGGLWPDQVLLLAVAPDVGLERQAVPDRIGGEGIEFQARVAAAFDEIARQEPARFDRIDASRDLDDVIRSVLDAIDRWSPS